MLYRLLLATITLPAHAHRMPECITTLSFVVTETKPQLEVAHRLHRHDGLRLVGTLMDLPENATLDVLELRARLALYIGERFSLRDAQSKAAIPLSLIGAETEGDYVWVYAVADGLAPTTLEVRSDVLAVLGDKALAQTFLEQDGRRLRFETPDGEGWALLAEDGQLDRGSSGR